MGLLPSWVVLHVALDFVFCGFDASRGSSRRPSSLSPPMGCVFRRRCVAGIDTCDFRFGCLHLWRSFGVRGLRLPAPLRRRDRHVRLPFWMPSPVAKIWRPSCALTSGRARGRSFIVSVDVGCVFYDGWTSALSDPDRGGRRRSKAEEEDHPCLVYHSAFERDRFRLKNLASSSLTHNYKQMANRQL